MMIFCVETCGSNYGRPSAIVADLSLHLVHVLVVMLICNQLDLCYNNKLFKSGWGKNTDKECKQNS